ncbi:MAG: hypothetical protein OEZ38_05300 [Gammaproteobacteria bacterium]|nr:hypothetical protein [Gammaproteobacteria bacterium]
MSSIASENTATLQYDDNDLKNDLRLLSKSKIFFGHQSVGGNIIDGLNMISVSNQIPLKILDDISDISSEKNFIAHRYIGKNEEPNLKIMDFSRMLEGGIGDHVDVAFMKFCYVDFKTDSKMSVEDVFDMYKTEFENIKNQYPDIQIIHVTTPLRTVQKGIKAEIKKLLGKSPAGYENNILRNKFNDLLKNEYEGKEPFFDLAKAESMRPDGTLETFTVDGNVYYALYKGYTYDRGHLNETGQKAIAIKLVQKLSQVIRINN